MLARKFRLTNPKDFERVQKEGKVFQSANFGIAYIKREDSEPNKFAFVISTKVARDATDRNRCKRAMSEAVRNESVHLVAGYDMVFLARPELPKLSTDEIMREVRTALRAAGFVK